MNDIVSTVSANTVLNPQLDLSDCIQLVIALITLCAVLVALFGQRFWNWFDRPKINVLFDRESERCFRWAQVGLCNIQDEGRHQNVTKQYFRLKVTNKGGFAKKLKVKVDLLDKRKRLTDRFEPSALSWITGESTVDLAREESEYVNLISQVIASPTQITNRLTLEISNTSPRGIAWDRSLDVYYLKIVIHGENFEPVTKMFRFRPDKVLSKPGYLTPIT